MTSGATKIGILGGGQLGRMLVQSAYNYNVEVHVLDPDENAPCATVTRYFSSGDITDEKTVNSFGKDLDIVTIEIENVSTSGLKQLQESGVKVFPQPGVIELIKSKSKQKQFFKENIPKKCKKMQK